MNKPLSIGCAALALLAIALCANYKRLIAHDIAATFRKEGLDTITLSVDAAGLHSARLDHITIGDEHPLTIGRAELGYSLADLWRSHLDSIVLEDVSIEGEIVDGRVYLYGLDSAFRELLSHDSTGMLPDYFYDPEQFFLDSLAIRNGTLHLRGEETDLTVPFDLILQRDETPYIAFESAGMRGNYKGILFSGFDISAFLDLRENQWQGQWVADGLAITYGQSPLVLRKAAGKLAIARLEANASFTLYGGQAGNSEGTLVIQAPFSSVTLRNSEAMLPASLTLPYAPAPPYKPGMDLRHLPADSLFFALVGHGDGPRFSFPAVYCGLSPLLQQPVIATLANCR